MARFPTTRWSFVAAAAEGDRQALEELCHAYWQPLYAYARRAGASPELAQEQVQDFLGAFVARNDFSRVDADRGRFRSYFLKAFRNHLANAHARATAQKRGRGHVAVTWEDVEGTYADDTASSPEQAYERQWARLLVDRARQRVGEAYKRRPELFEALFPSITGEGHSCTYAELAGRLDMSEGAVKVAVHRLRRRFRDALRAEVQQTTTDASQVDDELRHLLTVLA